MMRLSSSHIYTCIYLHDLLNTDIYIYIYNGYYIIYLQDVISYILYYSNDNKYEILNIYIHDKYTCIYTYI